MVHRSSLFELRDRIALLVKVLVDLSAWIAAAVLAVFMRFEFSIPNEYRTNLLKFLPIVAATQIFVGLAIGLYRRRWRYGSFDEVAALLATSVITTLCLAVINYSYLTPRLVPMSAIWFAGFVGLVLMAGERYVWRLLLERRQRPQPDAERLIVFGAGEGGVQVVNSMLRTPTSPFLPVAILDDDPAKRRLSIKGVPVVGGRGALASTAAQFKSSVLLIAVPSADHELIRGLTAEAQTCGLRVKMLPAVNELVGEAPQISDIRDLTEADLLGRHQIELDLESIATYLNGRRVLVTGAGGSIGSELCRQIARYGPRELVMLDRDESALHELQLSSTGRALLDTPEVVLCDIRDAPSVLAVFVARRPEVVFHAAALKHLPMLEQYPAEAVKANVWGTRNVLQAAEKVGVERFVNISTDKAANPISVLGFSKRVAERLTSETSRTASGPFLSVRFGNVLNSRGSVLTTFREQIARGGPVTVTHPDVTRFFMTIPEAVQLVIQAGAIGRPGEVLVLDMGAPIRILDVAQQMIAQSGRDIPVEISHLRPGEKVHEELFGDDEIDERPFHRLIGHAAVAPLRHSDVEVDLDHLDPETVRHWLASFSS
ncbi:MAG: polysaccharide biosynthesis protein [Actinomycetia bacterium]|nr:polysaccharide biosynthesis protein [Actinomycetes bacterium]